MKISGWAVLALSVGLAGWAFAAQAPRGVGVVAVQRANSASQAHQTGKQPWYAGIYHDSFSTLYRSPFGADRTLAPVTLRIRTPLSATSAAIILERFNGNQNAVATIPMRRLPESFITGALGAAAAKSQTLWEGVIPGADMREAGIVSYHFLIRDRNAHIYYGNNGTGYGGVGGVDTAAYEISGYHITVYDRSFTTPSWLRQGIIYEIFPDRFFNGNKANDENPQTQLAIGTTSAGKETLAPIQFHKNWYSLPYDPAIVPDPHSKFYAEQVKLRGDGNWSTDFFGGDLRGVEDKLAYLQSLGVNTLYLTPIFQSDSNHKYDTGNFLQIDPGFGTLKTWISLVKAAQARHMHIILDGVFEDTGSDSLYFNKFGNYHSVGAWQQVQNPQVKSPYYNWYQWNPGSNPPYYGWSGVETLPLTNTADRGWQQFVYGNWDPQRPMSPAKNAVARYWLAMGASGWRLDSANNSNFSVQWWTAFRKAVKQVDPNAAIIGEDWNNPTNDNGTDWLTGSTWDSTMNYPFRNAVISFFRGNYADGSVTNNQVNATTFGLILQQMLSQYPQPSMYAEMNLLGSQDTERILTILEGAPDAVLLTPFQQATWQPTKSQQSLGVRKLELVTDFQYGFVGVPAIYYGDEAGMIGYKDPLSRGTYPWGRANTLLVQHYRLLGNIRRTHPVLQSGNFTQLYAQGASYAFARTIRGGMDVFGRQAANATALIAVDNGKAETLAIPVNGLLPNGVKLYDALHGNRAYVVANGHVTVQLAAEGGAMLFSS